MSSRIRIQEHTSLNAIASWLQVGDEGLVFCISGESSFAPLTEGVALGVLHDLARRHVPIGVETTVTYDVRTVERLSILESLFGLALALSAQFVKPPNQADVHGELAAELWGRVLKSRGVVGKGNRTGLVFRDPDYWIPHRLRTENVSFPLRDQFRSELLKILRDQGFPREGYSRTENDAITFLYEAARNSHEHARVDINARAISSIRGIIAERIALSSPAELPGRHDFNPPSWTLDLGMDTAATELPSRHDLNPPLHEYIQRVWHTVSSKMRLFYALTVAALGPGIHNTLPALPGESSWDRLTRAFQPGQTRKKKTGDLDAGLGLAKLRASAERLHALLFVRSSDLLAFADFSSPSVDSDPAILRPWPDEQLRMGNSGTSLTLLWPALPDGGDQGTLF
jgi:hypothetical protein